MAFHRSLEKLEGCPAIPALGGEDFEHLAASISELAEREHLDRNEISRFLPTAFLAPDIVLAILKGKQPVDLTIERLRQMPTLPYRWKDQGSQLGFSE